MPMACSASLLPEINGLDTNGIFDSTEVRIAMASKGVARFGEIAIDFDRMEILQSGRIVSATALEFRILRFFVDNPHRVFSRQELLDAVWPQRERANGRTVDNVIGHLRQKLEKDAAHPTYLQTVYGAGYRFAPFPCASKSPATWDLGWTSDGRPEMRSPGLDQGLKCVKQS